MSLLPFPADSAEFEEYTSVMNAMADEAEASTPDPEPVHSDARYTDAELYPESQFGGDGPWNDYGDDFWTLTAHPKGWVPFWLESNNLTKAQLTI